MISVGRIPAAINLPCAPRSPDVCVHSIQAQPIDQSRIHPGASIYTHFLHFLYTERASLYKIFSSFRLRFSSSKQNLCEVMMDIVYIGAIAASLLERKSFNMGDVFALL